MNGSTQVWIVDGSSEPRRVPLRSNNDHEFFATEAEAFDFIAAREWAEHRHKQLGADEAARRAKKAEGKAESSRATEAARGTPGEGR